MCLNLNKVIVAGDVTGPELRYTSGENPLAVLTANLTVKNGQDVALAIPVKLFGDSAQKVNSWIEQGITSLAVIGSLHTEVSEQNGKKTYYTVLYGTRKVLPIASGIYMTDVDICGRLTKDVELYASNGDKKAFSRLTIAATKNRGTQAEHTEFVDCVAFDRTAENIARMFKKGSPIHVEGNLSSRVYTDKNGVKQTSYEVSVSRWDFMESKKTSSDSGNGSASAPVQTAPSFAGFGGIPLN